MPYGPSRRSVAALPLARREAISRAALRLFGAGQFHGVNVPRLAREAGVAEGTIYTYFRSKQDLARQVLAEATASLEQELRTSIPSQAGPLEQLELAGHVLLQLAEDDMDRARFVLCVDHTAYLGSDASQTLAASIEAIVASAASQGLVKPGGAALLSRVWLAVIAAAIHARASGDLDVGLGEIADTVARAALDAVRS